MISYNAYFKKHWIQRKILAAVLLLLFPFVVTIGLWIEYWEDVKDTWGAYVQAMLDGKGDKHE